jgi:transmembrane sensor
VQLDNERRSEDPVRRARAEASVWVVQLHGPNRSAEIESGFRAWLAESPDNAREFERVSDAWDAGSTPVLGIPRIRYSAPRNRPRLVMLTALGAFVVLGLALWALQAFWLSPSYATGLGEQRVLRLSEGTRITLNSDTRISVEYRESERGVRVDRGEAYFEVAKDAGRPFWVRAGDHRVQALGTAFIVRHEAGRTAVTLVEGKIAVTRDDGAVNSIPEPVEPSVHPTALEKQIILTPGERLTFVGGSRGRLDVPRMDAVTAWRRSEIVLDHTPLADAVAEMNRYDQTTLVIEDPQVAALRVSGIYHTGNSETFANMIAHLYGLEAVRQDGRIRLMAPALPPTR